MGYDLHVTRKIDWTDKDGPQITFEEWNQYVVSDPDIEEDPINEKHDFLFVKHPVEPVPLWWDRGEVYTKNPDEQTLNKLINIANKLGARVLGDDGELYTESNLGEIR